MRLAYVSIVLAACTTSNPIEVDCPAGAPTPSTRPPPSGRSRVAYTTAVNGRPQLFMLDVAQTGAAPVRLDATGTADGPLAPWWGPALMGVWSPAGGQIAVRTGGSLLDPAALGVIDVAVPGTVRAPGSDNIAPFPWLADGEDVWSPDGSRLVTIDAAALAARVVRADGSGGVRIASNLGQLSWPSWSPDGTYVGVPVSEGGGPARLFVTPADDEAPREVASQSFRWGAAGSQLLGYLDAEHWDVIDVEADVHTIVRVAAGTAPVFNGDGTWLLASGPPQITLRARGCGEPITLPGPSFAWEAVATADGDHLAFSDDVATGIDGLGAKLWVADRAGDAWTLRHLYTPTTPERRADWPVASARGSRIAWLLGGNETDRFLVTQDGVRDPAKVPAPGIVASVVAGTYWFSPDLRRLGYLAGERATASLRVLALDDPSAPVMLGELVPPAGGSVEWVSWSPDGNAFGYSVWTTRDTSPIPSDLYVTRISGGALESPRLLGTTLNQANAAFHWEP